MMTGVQRVVLLCSVGCIIAAVAPLSPADTGNSATYYYHYFDQQRWLDLDPQRVAIQAADGNEAARLVDELAAFGVDGGNLEEVAVPGWAMAATPAGVRDAAEIELLVSSLAGARDIGFASPVFIDNRGLPLLITRDLLVGFHENVSPRAAEKLLAERVPGTSAERDFAGLPGVYRVRTSLKNGFEVLDLANSLATLPEVRYAESDMIIRATLALIPNDPLFSQQWALNQANDQDMDAPEAWDITTGDGTIVVAILDCGIQQGHPDLNQIPGQDFTQHNTPNGGPYNHCDNHGTCVVGCVSAIINNSKDVVGVAPHCVSVSAKMGTVIDFFGICTPFMDSQASYVANALNWVVSSGYHVTNSSFGFNESSTVTTAYNNAYANGVINFAATGNSGGSGISYPASLSSVVAVGALNSSGNKASFGQYGPGIAFSAPGEGILTTDRTGSDGYESGDTVTVDGTSFSSPYAAGVGALILSQDPSLTPAEVEQTMNDTCVDLGAAGYDTTYGWGFVNAYNAVLAVNPDPEGACCFADGSCLVQTQSDCSATWLGAGTTCLPNPCPQPQGACCYADGSCLFTTLAGCGGSWLGMGTDCDPNPCPPPGCPGDSNCDNWISWRDVDFFVAAINDNVAAWEAMFAPGTPTCPFSNNDVNEDGTVNWRDIDPLAALMNTLCP
ncbi:MAG: S8 family serine peptidase [Phycisphaerae bacterium]|nr:S8 family serine peptidase [Phycisphaerae bacterium]